MSATITAKRRLVVAAGWGVVATLAMTAVMLLGVGSGISPMPDPIPAALVTHTLGALPQPTTLGLAVLVHLTYGAAAAVVLAAVSSRVTVWAGARFGGLLWVLVGVLWVHERVANDGDDRQGCSEVGEPVGCVSREPKRPHRP